MLLHHLVETSKAVRATRSRKEKVAHLAALLRALPTDERTIGVDYLAGAIPGGRISVGPSLLRDASPGAAAGDPTLSLTEVQAILRSLATIEGAGSKKAKTERLGHLLARCTVDEQSFLGPLVLGEVRQGALAGLMAEAIAHAFDVPIGQVRRAAMFAGSLSAVAVVAADEGEVGLGRFDLELFRPIQPMLAQTATDPEDAIAKLGPCVLEDKLDGARIQVHRDEQDVRVYTRRLHDVTAAVPELVEMVRALPARRIVLDGEAIALRPDRRPHPFQTTMRRFGRKRVVDALRDTLPVSGFFFDALRIDDQRLVDAPTSTRIEALEALVPAAARIRRARVQRSEEAESFYDAALAAGHEGVMAKALDAPYEAGGRGGAWLKVKLSHTLDLVILAAEWGSGRREGWLSNLHLGARDPTGGFVMLGKTFKGMTDETLIWQTKALQERAIGQDAGTVYVRPELVVEVAFNELQQSPHYPGGLALRFARLKRYRTDKTAEQADTLETVRRLASGSH